MAYTTSICAQLPAKDACSRPEGRHGCFWRVVLGAAPPSPNHRQNRLPVTSRASRSCPWEEEFSGRRPQPKLSAEPTHAAASRASASRRRQSVLRHERCIARLRCADKLREGVKVDLVTPTVCRVRVRTVGSLGEPSRRARRAAGALSATRCDTASFVCRRGGCCSTIQRRVYGSLGRTRVLSPAKRRASESGFVCKH